MDKSLCYCASMAGVTLISLIWPLWLDVVTLDETLCSERRCRSFSDVILDDLNGYGCKYGASEGSNFEMPLTDMKNAAIQCGNY